jgi:hypothetical protein
MDKKTLALIEEGMTNEIMRITRGEITRAEAAEVARKATMANDWDNWAVQHKGLVWVAAPFLKEIGYEFVFESRRYEKVAVG